MIKFKGIIFIGIITLFILTTSFFGGASLKKRTIAESENVAELLMNLGEKKPLHYKENLNLEMIQKGKELVTTGRTTDLSGKKVKLQSRHFKCINCHNLVKEDPDLSINNPETRLDYAIKNDLPFLPGTTLYGTVNRRHWYNDDYYKKYGDLVRPAKDTLANAVQLCAKECSKGREFEPWELDAVLQYLWILQLKVSDLNLTSEEYYFLESFDESSDDKIGLINRKYIDRSYATFLDPLPKKDRKFGVNGDARRGRELLDRSCRHCHHPDKEISKYRMEFNKLSTKHLWKNSGKSNNFSLYVVSRKGFYQIGSRETYMPHYTKERLNHRQIEDMIAFLRSMK